jgi:hypothetical protein
LYEEKQKRMQSKIMGNFRSNNLWESSMNEGWMRRVHRLMKDEWGECIDESRINEESASIEWMCFVLIFLCIFHFSSWFRHQNK